jgi:hypothetical protein
MGWLFIIMGIVAFSSGIANYRQDGNALQLLMYLILLIICISGDKFVFRKIAQTQCNNYMREKIIMDIDDLHAIILRSIEKVNDVISSSKIFSTARNIKMESGIEIAYGNRGAPTYGWISLKPYSKPMRRYLQQLSQIIDNEINEYQKLCGK